MRFYVGNFPTPSDQVICCLARDNWNDWFCWYTLYKAILRWPDGGVVVLGDVKIGQAGMSRENGRTALPSEFEELNSDFFSIGQSENYYETLLTFDTDLKTSYLKGINDCAFDLSLFKKYQAEPVMSESLLRSISVRQVERRFHALTHGRAELTPYKFAYEFPNDPAAWTDAPVLTFDVSPGAMPPTNLHVIIGRNGVGKSRCFDMLSRAFLGLTSKENKVGVGRFRVAEQIAPLRAAENSADFVGLTVVSFSAFDNRGPIQDKIPNGKSYNYIGLVERKGQSDESVGGEVSFYIKGMKDLADEFAESVGKCREGVRQRRWLDALNTLEADPLFAEVNVSELAEVGITDVLEKARNLFSRLSSGHAVVLLSITRLVELVEERSLVLIDEPESHLHPPLLSSFVRALSSLLAVRNGVALLATHSPVVLQEVPANCVWKLTRSGHEVAAARINQETFGENIGVLTREVFELEVLQTGFHKLVSEQIQNHSFEEILHIFNGQLGADARSLARSLVLMRERRTSDQGGTAE